jgi:hypothetical protein
MQVHQLKTHQSGLHMHHVAQLVERFSKLKTVPGNMVQLDSFNNNDQGLRA